MLAGSAPGDLKALLTPAPMPHGHRIISQDHTAGGRPCPFAGALGPGGYVPGDVSVCQLEAPGCPPTGTPVTGLPAAPTEHSSK